jgi:hypothetical protein
VGAFFVSDIPLPVSFRPLWKAATRHLVMAFTAPGQTGPERVAALLNVSRGTISKWCGDQYDDQMPGQLAMQLEFLLQRQIFSPAFASLTNSRVVPITDSDEHHDDSLMAGLFQTLEQIGQLQKTWVEAAADGRHTPAEKKAVKEELFKTIDVLNEQVRRLGMGEGRL